MLPNLLTGLRIFLIVPICAGILIHSETSLLAAFFLFVIACSTDYFDGYIAKATRRKSALGAMLDPLADKLLCTSVIFCLAQAQRLHIVIFFFWLIMLGRDLMISSLRSLYGHSFLIVNSTAKLKTTLQMLGLALLIAPVGLEASYFTFAVLGAASFLSILSAFYYLIPLFRRKV